LAWKGLFRKWVIYAIKAKHTFRKMRQVGLYRKYQTGSVFQEGINEIGANGLFCCKQGLHTQPIDLTMILFNYLLLYVRFPTVGVDMAWAAG